MPFTNVIQRDKVLSALIKPKYGRATSFSTPAGFFKLYNHIRTCPWYHEFKITTSRYHSIYAFDDNMIEPTKFAWAVYYFIKKQL